VTALRPLRAEGPVVLAAATLAAATTAIGIALRSDGVAIGVPTPPFILDWSPAAEPLSAIAALLALSGAVAAAPRLLVWPARPWAFAALLLALALVLHVVVGTVRHGRDGLDAVLDPAGSREGKNEYLPALRALSYGPGFLLDRFSELVPSLPVHAAGHPPGLLLTMHWLGIDTPAQLAALCIGAGALMVPLGYALARELLETERQARVAALLILMSPAVIDFGATSADALYATLGVGAALLLVRRQLLGAVALAVASFYAWSLLAVGAWAVVLAWRREGLAHATHLAAACAVAVLGFYALLAAATGYDPVGAFHSTEQVYRLGIASMRPYAYWLFASPVAWAVAAGIPIAAWWLRAVVRGRPAALALAAVVAAAAVGGFTKAETERIWLFLVPFACIAAAEVLPRRRLMPVVAFLAVQTALCEVLFESAW
jgi:hypothetical protein